MAGRWPPLRKGGGGGLAGWERRPPCLLAPLGDREDLGHARRHMGEEGEAKRDEEVEAGEGGRRQ